MADFRVDMEDLRVGWEKCTFPSMTETQEFVVPRSIPMTSVAAGFVLHAEH